MRRSGILLIVAAVVVFGSSAASRSTPSDASSDADGVRLSDCMEAVAGQSCAENGKKECEKRKGNGWRWNKKKCKCECKGNLTPDGKACYNY